MPKCVVGVRPGVGFLLVLQFPLFEPLKTFNVEIMIVLFLRGFLRLRTIKFDWLNDLNKIVGGSHHRLETGAGDGQWGGFHLIHLTFIFAIFIHIISIIQMVLKARML